MRTRIQRQSDDCSTLAELRYKSCLANPDVYMKLMMDQKGNKCWSYMLVYVADCLLVHREPDPWNN